MFINCFVDQPLFFRTDYGSFYFQEKCYINNDTNSSWITLPNASAILLESVMLEASGNCQDLPLWGLCLGGLSETPIPLC